MNICEIFGPTLQGEGDDSGKIAVFVRLWGCVAPFCDFCDTDYSWKKSFKPRDKPLFEVMSIQEIEDAVMSLFIGGNISVDERPTVIITGGEPFMQEQIYDLIDKLDDTFKVVVETSGKSYIDMERTSEAYITMSPKCYDKETFLVDDRTDINGTVDYLKFVIGNENDVEMALSFIAEHSIDKDQCFFMPLGAGREEQLKNLPWVFNECVKNGIRLSARVHVLAFDTKRGV